MSVERLLQTYTLTSVMSAKFQYPVMCRLTDRCVDDNCSKEHNGHICVCGAIMPKYSIQSHLAGKKHAQRVKELGVPAIPTDVQTSRTSTTEQQSFASPPKPRNGNDAFTHCTICDKDIPSFRWHFHLTHRDHLQALDRVAIQAALDKVAKNKDSVQVSGELSGIDFGITEPGGLNSVQLVTMRTTEHRALVFLADFKMTSSGRSQTSR